MSYRFRFREPVDAEFRRIADQQVRLCIEAAGDPASANVPHEIRKHCKKLRALLRLVRGSFDDHAREQRVVRDAARALAPVRDAAAHIEALDRLQNRDPMRYGIAELDAARARLDALQRADHGPAAQAEAIRQAVALLEEQGRRVPDWHLRDGGFDALSEGLGHTYRKGRAALSDVRDHPSADRFHALRKSVKPHRFHLELLRPLWKQPIGAVVHQADRLGDLLGEHHDLHVLGDALAHPEGGTDGLDPDRYDALVRPERDRLERQALRIADRLYAEKPTALCRRFARYWAAGATAASKRGA